MKRELNAQQATTRLLALVGQTPTDETLREAVEILVAHTPNLHVRTAALAVLRLSRGSE